MIEWTLKPLLTLQSVMSALHTGMSVVQFTAQYVCRAVHVDEGQVSRRLGVEVHVPVDNNQQLQQQPLMARGSYYLLWIWCQIQLLWPILKGLVASVIWMDWLRVPQEAFAVLRSNSRRTQMLRWVLMRCTFCSSDMQLLTWFARIFCFTA